MPSRSLHAQSAFRTKQATYGTSSDTALSSRTHRILLRTRSAEIVQRTQKWAQDASPFGYALSLSALNVGQCADSANSIFSRLRLRRTFSTTHREGKLLIQYSYDGTFEVGAQRL